MNKFSWSKALGFGVLIWAIATAVLAILGQIQSIGPLWAHGIIAGIAAISAYLFTRNAQPASAEQALGYGVIWAVIMLVLDLAATQWFDAHVFSAWQYWIGPALVFLAPQLPAATSEQGLGHPV